MLRFLLIYLSQAVWARKLVQGFDVAQRMAARFVAGETLDQAIRVVKKLNAQGISTTLDHLGENVNTEGDARQATEEILTILDRLNSEGVISGVSIKLSQIGLVVDPVLCEENLLQILDAAKQKNIFIRVDMEDSQLTDQTLELFTRVSKKGELSSPGIAIQAYLFRSEDDVRKLLESESPIRLCKGAYKESPTIAFPKKSDVDKNFDKLTDLLLDSSLDVESKISADGSFPPIPAIATHDQLRIDHALVYAKSINLPKQGLEFQMLYGIRADLQEELTSRGYPVRVYVPYGSEWYPYFVRRLAERPANLWFFLSNLFRK
ncbi:MAG: proline dehydrogenase family protein [Anaerolineales bacterium]